MKKTRQILSVLLAVLMLVLSAPFAFAQETAYQVGDHIQFGSYPQTKVTDEETIAALDAAEKTWISYGYYVNGASSDFMKYADIAYNGDSYRAVTFSDYRPRWNNDPPSDTCQDTNGYLSNTVYYFKYEPLNWSVLDPATGLVLCEDIVDVQTFNNTHPFTDDDGITYWVDSTKQNYADDYSVSDIRTWLNENFYQTAFTQEQGSAIQTTTVKNNAGSTQFDDTYDKLFLLSIEDVLNTAYGFNSIFYENDAKRQATATDYAKCQGFEDYWWLRSGDDEGFYGRQFYYSARDCNAESGTASSFSAVYCACNGVRPACCLKGDLSEETITFQDPKTDKVTLKCEPGTFPNDAKLKVTTVDYEEIYRLMQQGIFFGTYDYYKAIGYDILIYGNSHSYQPQRPCTVRLWIPAGYDTDHMVIYHRDPVTGAKTKITNYHIEGNEAVFTTNLFSEYGIIDTTSLIGPHTHAYNYKEEITRTPTCIDPGEGIYTCECGESETRELGIDPTNHVNTENKAAVASTCTVKGFSAGVYCNDCKTWVSGHEEQPLAAHTPAAAVKENEIVATEEHGGSFDEVVYCSVCGSELSRVTKTTDPLTPETPTDIDIEPDDNQPGLITRIIDWFRSLIARILGFFGIK